jgi:putative phage-type endonuclease
MTETRRKSAPAGLSPISPAFVMPGLTPDQLAMRAHGIGSSDADKIMAGDWGKLWQEKMGLVAREDLSAVLAVQMGNVTEAFNAWWFEQRTGHKVNRAPVVIDRTHQHDKRPWMLANIDGLVTIDSRVRLFEAKHTNAFGSKGDAPAKYLAQVQHTLEVLDLEGCEMSVFFGNTDWQTFSIERDRDYGLLLMEREAEFWEHVTKGVPPPGSVDAGPPAPGLELMRQIDFRENNAWNDQEVTWMDKRPHRAAFDEAESKLKEMMPGDCDFAFGQSLVCVRDRAGKLSLRYPNKKDMERVGDLIEAGQRLEEVEL